MRFYKEVSLLFWSFFFTNKASLYFLRTTLTLSGQMCSFMYKMRDNSIVTDFTDDKFYNDKELLF